MLYELISCKPPVESIIRSHALAEDEPDPLTPATQVGKDRYPVWLLQLTDQLLNTKAKERPQGCQEVLQALEQRAIGDPATIQIKSATSKTRLVNEAERWDEPAPKTAQGTRVVSESQRFQKKTNYWPWAVLALVGLASGAAYLATQDASVAWMEQSGIRGDKPAGNASLPATDPNPSQPRETTPPAPPPVPMTGQLQINVDAPNARVWLDGQEIGNAGPNRPLDKEGLASGSHRLRIEAEGRQPWEGAVEIQRGQWRQVAAELKPVEDPREYRDPTSGMEFVKIDGGSFLMGSPENETDHESNEKQHRVSVGSFWLGKTEVTNAQYRRFKPGHDSGSDFNGDNQPVVAVDWNDATAYAEWLSQKTGKKYRLPTEAEWEYAARAGTTTAYAWGNDLGKNRANCDGCGSRWDNKQAAPAGSFPANAWGLHDMHGNVWEWTCSAYDEGYGGGEKQCSSKNDASGSRVLRGGSWNNTPGGLRAAIRNNGGPDYRSVNIGFRLAQDL